MKKIYYKKLVRDKIPRRIEESAGKYKTEILSDEKYKKELLNKAEEEAGGLSRATIKEEMVAEMGDLLDVLREIKKAFKITSGEVKESRVKEMKRKGGFKKKVYLVWAEDTGYRSNEKKGKKNKRSLK